MSYEDELKNALSVLRSGGVILYPTDTIWGIGCDATNDQAIKKIFSIKQRNESKSMIILADDESRVMRYVKDIPPNTGELIEYSDRPLTIIYPNAINLPAALIAQDGSVAIRIVKDEFCRQLIYKLNKPIVSTSANISNQPAPVSFKEIAEVIKQAVDCVINLRQHEKKFVQPSVIVKLEMDGKIKFIRM